MLASSNFSKTKTNFWAPESTAVGNHTKSSELYRMLGLAENLKLFVSSLSNSTKTKYHENIIYKFVKVHKNCRFQRMQNIFIHVVTQVNKLTLPVNCCVWLFLFASECS